MTGQVPTPLSFLEAVQGFTEGGSRSSADRPIRLAVVDPAYNAWAGYPSAPPPARVTFEGESTLSTKAYGYVGGFIPWPGLRVFLVPIGNTYVIGGAIQTQTPQGFWSNAAGTESGVEFGGGSYLDTDEGLVIAGDAAISGDLSVAGVGAVKWKRKPSDTSRTNTVTVATDPHLTGLVLEPGTWELWVSLNMSGSTGDIKTKWIFTGGAADTLKTCWGPSDATELQSRTNTMARMAVHQPETEVGYGLNDTGAYASALEWGLVTVTTQTSWSLQWAQQAADATNATQLRSRSYARATRLE
jgi:hypothetical protein